jgi:hypothetical protein
MVVNWTVNVPVRPCPPRRPSPPPGSRSSAQRSPRPARSASAITGTSPPAIPDPDRQTMRRSSADRATIASSRCPSELAGWSFSMPANTELSFGNFQVSTGLETAIALTPRTLTPAPAPRPPLSLPAAHYCSTDNHQGPERPGLRAAAFEIRPRLESITIRRRAHRRHRLTSIAGISVADVAAGAASVIAGRDRHARQAVAQLIEHGAVVHLVVVVHGSTSVVVAGTSSVRRAAIAWDRWARTVPGAIRSCLAVVPTSRSRKTRSTITSRCRVGRRRGAVSAAASRPVFGVPASRCARV